jgi:hypothetical protein
MKTALAGLAAVSMLVAVADTKPAEAMPIQKLGLSEVDALSNTTQVQYRRYHGRRAVIVAPGAYAYDYGYYAYGSPYYAYASPYPYWDSYYAYGSPYWDYGYYHRPGLWIGVGPFGVGVGW